MVTPTTSVRLPQEHHQLIHDIVRAIKSDPAIVAQLRGVIDGRNTAIQTDRNTCDTDVLQAFQEKLTLQEKTTLSLMAMVENIADRLKALEQPAEPARPAATRKRQGRVTDDVRCKAREMRDQGRTYKEIATALDLGDGTVWNILNKP